MQVESLHTFDRVITSAIVTSQVGLAWLFFGEWRRRISRRAFALATAMLCAIWAVVGYGFLFNAVADSVHPLIGPNWLHGLGSCVEFLWALLSICVVAVYLLYGIASRRFNTQHQPIRRKILQGVALAAVAAPVGAIAFGGIIGRTHYRVLEVDFPIRNLHPDLQGLRIAQVSDFHVSAFLSVREAARVVDMTNELKPQVTFMTGDLITEGRDPLDAAIRELGRLKADAGVFGCLGNHEAYARCENYLTREAARLGVHFLRRSSVQLQFGAGKLNIGGVDFQPARYRSRYLAGAEKLIQPGTANILLSHNPDVFPKAIAQGWDGMLSGHTHGGQVTFEIFEQSINLARFITPWVAGLYRLNGASCYVNRGIGTIGMPVRIGEAPEITLLRLVRA